MIKKSEINLAMSATEQELQGSEVDTQQRVYGCQRQSLATFVLGSTEQ